MTTALKTKKNGRKMIQRKPVSPPKSVNQQKPKLVGLAALLSAPAPGLFKDAAEIDAHIREGRGEWDNED